MQTIVPASPHPSPNGFTGRPGRPGTSGMRGFRSGRGCGAAGTAPPAGPSPRRPASRRRPREHLPMGPGRQSRDGSAGPAAGWAPHQAHRGGASADRGPVAETKRRRSTVRSASVQAVVVSRYSPAASGTIAAVTSDANGITQVTKLTPRPPGTDAGVAGARVAETGVAGARVAETGVAGARVAETGVAGARVAETGVAGARVAETGVAGARVAETGVAGARVAGARAGRRPARTRPAPFPAPG